MNSKVLKSTRWFSGSTTNFQAAPVKKPTMLPSRGPTSPT